MVYTIASVLFFIFNIVLNELIEKADVRFYGNSFQLGIHNFIGVYVTVKVRLDSQGLSVSLMTQYMS